MAAWPGTPASATSRAAAAVEAAVRVRAPGSRVRSQSSHWPSACGWLCTTVTSSTSPSGAISAKDTGTSTSALMCILAEASWSMVAGTTPRTEFSSGTTAASHSPRKAASSAAATLRKGRCAGSRSGGTVGSSRRSAVCVKVPSGPR